MDPVHIRTKKSTKMMLYIYQSIYQGGEESSERLVGAIGFEPMTPWV